MSKLIIINKYKDIDELEHFFRAMGENISQNDLSKIIEDINIDGHILYFYLKNILNINLILINK